MAWVQGTWMQGLTSAGWRRCTGTGTGAGTSAWPGMGAGTGVAHGTGARHGVIPPSVTSPKCLEVALVKSKDLGPARKRDALEHTNTIVLLEIGQCSRPNSLLLRISQVQGKTKDQNITLGTAASRAFIRFLLLGQTGQQLPLVG